MPKKRLTTEEFIERSMEANEVKYDYSKAVYVNQKTKVTVICSEHGEFLTNPSDHMRGHGCPKCANVKRGRFDGEFNTETFKRRAIDVHGDRYDYSKTEYVNASTKAIIICREKDENGFEHGEFKQLPLLHLKGKGCCPKCNGRGSTTESIVSEFKKVHGDRYDYSKVEFNGRKDGKVCIICKEHGEFWQTVNKHVRGQGCPKCGKDSMGKLIRLGKEAFIDRANSVHKGKYIYDKVKFESSHDKITITCPKHGDFTQYVYDHLNGYGCPKCGMIVSHAENEIYDYLSDRIGPENIIRNTRDVLENGSEIDLYLPKYKIGIEFNGLKWHSEEFNKMKEYHLSKTVGCEKQGIRLIQIFEDEYLFHKNIVLNKLSHIIGIHTNRPKIMARKCNIVEIDSTKANNFLNLNHIQGGCKSSVSIAATYCGLIVGVMSFTKENNDGEWVLSRFATDNKFICQGIGSRLFSYFKRVYEPSMVKSFADRRWSSMLDNIYEKMGFKLDKVLPPDYKYVKKTNPTERIHKFNLRKKSIHRKYGLPMDMTESEMVDIIGLSKIWDCGLIRYVWSKE